MLQVGRIDGKASILVLPGAGLASGSPSIGPASLVDELDLAASRKVERLRSSVATGPVTEAGVGPFAFAMAVAGTATAIASKASDNDRDRRNKVSERIAG